MRKVFILVIAMAILLAGCAVLSPATEPTSSSVPTPGEHPTTTSIPTPTPAPAPKPTPTTPPPPQTYIVSLESIPSGAHAWLNGNDTGQETPFTFNAENGTHTVVLKLDGYQDCADRIYVNMNVAKTEILQKIVESPEAYKAKAQEIEYKVLEKSPDKFKGTFLTFTGKVVQIIEDSGVTFMRVEVTDLGYSIYTDVVGVFYQGSIDVYKDDIITFWGEGSGTYSYKSQAGWNIEIPSVKAKYVEK
jgi:hypothetical protein